MSINHLLSMNLNIPAYQRPYKWTIRNIEELLGDVNNAISDAQKYRSGFKYRIGTIILHRTGSGKKKTFDIVDGQQRVISLALLKLFLDDGCNCSILNRRFTNKISQSNIHINYGFIREWFSLKKDNVAEMFLDAFEDILEVVVIQVEKVSEAFQLFDSQNTRGKALDPHDLLKAYHLQEMKKYPYEMEHAGFDSINKYAIGEDNSRYTNKLAVFPKMSLARVHTEISNLQVRVLREPDDAAHEKWRGLYTKLKKINGLTEEEDGE